MNMFNSEFGQYVCIGDSIECEINGITYKAVVVYDDDTHIDNDDVHNINGMMDEGVEELYINRAINARDAWFREDWFYCGIVINAVNADGWTRGHLNSLRGIECNYPNSSNDYLTIVANHLLNEVLEVSK